MNNNETITVRDAWYAAVGPESDVVLSSRVRLARNLANFLFVTHSSSTESERVLSLVFGAFSSLKKPDQYQAIRIHDLEESGKNIFIERGVLSNKTSSSDSSGIVIRTDGRFSCTINEKDHLRLSAFSTGLQLNDTYDLCKSIDDELQKTLQFAASFDFGYLTTSLNHVGTGMKVSLRLHLPSITYSGSLKETVDIIPDGYALSSVYGVSSDKISANGCIYQLSSVRSFPSCEYDQLDNLTALALHIIEIERKARAEFINKKPTVLRDSVYKAYALAKYSRMLSCIESICILADIKWGIDSGILQGVSDSVISALFFRVQPAHLGFVIKSGNFNYEKDIITDEMRVNRLRSLVIQEALDNLQIVVYEGC